MEKIYISACCSDKGPLFEKCIAPGLLLQKLQYLKRMQEFLYSVYSVTDALFFILPWKLSYPCSYISKGILDV